MDINDSEIHAILINSVRYCTTRRSYAPQECADFIRSRWAEIPERTKKIIIKDIDESICMASFAWPDDIQQAWESLRELGSEYLPQQRSLPPYTNDQQ